MQRVWRIRRDIGITLRGDKRLSRQRRHVVGVNDVMRESGMVRFFPE
jgi:hypothetical protein